MINLNIKPIEYSSEDKHEAIEIDFIENCESGWLFELRHIVDKYDNSNSNTDDEKSSDTVDKTIEKYKIIIEDVDELELVRKYPQIAFAYIAYTSQRCRCMKYVVTLEKSDDNTRTQKYGKIPSELDIHMSNVPFHDSPLLIRSKDPINLKEYIKGSYEGLTFMNTAGKDNPTPLINPYFHRYYVKQLEDYNGYYAMYEIGMFIDENGCLVDKAHSGNTLTKPHLYDIRNILTQIYPYLWEEEDY